MEKKLRNGALVEDLLTNAATLIMDGVTPLDMKHISEKYPSMISVFINNMEVDKQYGYTEYLTYVLKRNDWQNYIDDIITNGLMRRSKMGDDEWMKLDEYCIKYIRFCESDPWYDQTIKDMWREHIRNTMDDVIVAILTHSVCKQETIDWITFEMGTYLNENKLDLGEHARLNFYVMTGVRTKFWMKSKYFETRIFKYILEHNITVRSDYGYHIEDLEMKVINRIHLMELYSISTENPWFLLECLESDVEMDIQTLQTALTALQEQMVLVGSNRNYESICIATRKYIERNQR